MSMPTETSPNPAHPSLGSQLVPLRRSSGWLLAAGIALVVLGVVGLGSVTMLSIASAIWFGIMMLAGGVIVLIGAFRSEGWKSVLLHLLIGALYLGVGVFTLVNPVAATASLTLFVGAALLATGVLRIVVSLQNRNLPYWVWILVSGLLSLLLGAMILFQWPSSSLWVLGTFLAIELIFQGWGVIALARAIRSTFDGSAVRKG